MELAASTHSHLQGGSQKCQAGHREFQVAEEIDFISAKELLVQGLVFSDLVFKFEQYNIVFWTKMINIQGPTVNYFGV